MRYRREARELETCHPDEISDEEEEGYGRNDDKGQHRGNEIDEVSEE
ncbi:MAG: hypothetical protein KA152_14535 [Verrucomicrobiales bacterium]|nr:hypothetical protein [Verrucomicrobiales bacterium]